MSWYKNWKDNYKKREKIADLINRREMTMTNLVVGLTTEESIQMFEEVEVLFKNAMEKRLKRINEEKLAIEKWSGKN